MNSQKVSRGEDIIPAAINALLDQRARFQSWIDKLDRKRGDTSPDVFRKVLGDYQARLEEVEAELADHRAELQSALDERRKRVEQLEEQRSARAAELEEVELRYAVGEFEEDEWTQLKNEHLAELNTTGERLSAEQDAVRSLEEVLVELAEPGRARLRLEPAEDGEADEPAEEDEEDEADVSRAAGRNRIAAGGAKDRKFLDELEFLESLSVEDAEELDSVSITLDDEEGEGRD